MPPGFIATHPAPADWQERVKSVDPELWVAWNPHHQDGARWSVVRFLGARRAPGGGVLIERKVTDDSLLSAWCHGWAVVTHIETRDGTPCELDDRIMLYLRQEAEWRKSVVADPTGAINESAREVAAAAKRLEDEHAGRMADAFEDTQRDHVITRKRVSA